MKKIAIIFYLMQNILFAQNWAEVANSINSNSDTDDRYGSSVSVSGNFAIVGARKDSEIGTASILKFNSSTNAWDYWEKLVGIDAERGDNFGCAVAIFGDYAIVGASLEGQNDVNGNPASSFGAAFIFKYNSSRDRWEVMQKLDLGDNRTHNDYFGYSVSIGDGYAIIGAYAEDEDAANANNMENAGSAFIYKYVAVSDSWVLQKKIVASNRTFSAYFGYSVSISGDYVVVGSPNYSGGKAYVFYKTTDSRLGTEDWNEVAVFTSTDIESGDNFGCSVGLSNGVAIIGARTENEDQNGNNTLNDAGSAYFFENVSGTWSQVQKICTKDRDLGDYFGVAVSISGEYAVIGAMWEDENASNQNTLSGSGSAYIFQYNNTTEQWEQKQKIVASDRGTGDYFGISVSISGNNAIVGASYNDGDGGLTDAGSAYIFYNDPVAAPVELTSFIVKSVGESVVLSWSTATEVNNYGFEIQKSVEASRDLPLQWETIAFVNGHGNSNSPNDYSFIDTDDLNGTIQYRLKQLDFDGSFEYSDIVKIVAGNKLQYKLAQNYPNPFNPTTVIEFAIPKLKSEMSNVKLVVSNILGEEVAVLVNKQMASGTHSVSFDASNLPSGIYFYSISVNGFTEVKKMSLIK
jgi:hypothetical protein